MYSIQNNNIKCVSPEGKKYLVCLHYLQKQLLPIIVPGWETVEAKIKDRINPEFVKATVMVKKFKGLMTIDDKFMQDIQDKLEKGETVIVNNWSFATHDRVPKELKKIEIKAELR
jgi:hypothetical protein